VRSEAFSSLKADASAATCNDDDLVGHVAGDSTDTTFEVFFAWKPAHERGGLLERKINEDNNYIRIEERYKHVGNLFLGKNFRVIRQFLWKVLVLFSDKIKCFVKILERKQKKLNEKEFSRRKQDLLRNQEIFSLMKFGRTRIVPIEIERFWGFVKIRIWT